MPKVRTLVCYCLSLGFIVFSLFTVLGCSKRVSGVSGGFGLESRFVSLSAPTGLTLSVDGATSSVTLSWSDNNTIQDGYRIHVTRSNSGGGVTDETSATDRLSRSYVISSLLANVPYVIYVTAFNAIGESLPSNSQSVTLSGPAGRAPIQAPKNLSAEVLSDTKVKISWESSGADLVTGYSIESKYSSDDFKEVGQVTAQVLSFTVTGLESDSDYKFRVRSFNGSGNSPYSDIVAAKTLLEPANAVPFPPRDLSASYIEAQGMRLRWSDPNAGTMNQAESFILERSIGAVSNQFSQIATVQKNNGGVSFLDLTVQQQTTYSYRVKAKNMIGVSEYSNIVTVTPIANAGQVPNAPTGLTLFVDANGKVSLNWQNNPSNAYPASENRIYKSSDGVNFSKVATLLSTVSSYADTVGQEASLSYYVTAANQMGESIPSNTALITLLRPVMPAGLSVSAISTTSVTLIWNIGNGKVDGFKVYRSLDGEQYAMISSMGGDVLSYKDSGLQPNTTYLYKVESSNSAGPASAFISVRTSAELPPAPLQLIATTASDIAIILQWGIPSFTNGNRPEGYQIYRSLTGVAGSFQKIGTVSGASSNSFTDASCAAGTSYYYQLLSFNSAGVSGFSNIDSAKTVLGAPPGAPAGLVAVAVKSKLMSLTWRDTLLNETGFEIWRGTSPSYLVKIATVGPNVVSYQDSTVVQSSTYYYKVRGYNSMGYTAFSVIASESTPPETPSGLVGSLLSSGQIQLRWVDNSREQSFSIERSTDGKAFAEIGVVGPYTAFFIDCNVSANIVYYYRVRAKFGVTYSDYSAVFMIKSGALESQPCSNTGCYPK